LDNILAVGFELSAVGFGAQLPETPHSKLKTHHLEAVVEVFSNNHA
jgi:hypothetical protein